MPSEIYAASLFDGALRQGEVLSDIIQLELAAGLAAFPGENDALLLNRRKHPLAVTIAQDCDLEWDHRFRTGQASPSKELPSVLLCEVFDADKLPHVDSGVWKRIKINKDERYQFLEKVPAECDAQGLGLPEMAIDFKHCFSIPTAELYLQLKGEAKRRCRLVSPYLEHFQQRIFYFHSRIGLPADHHSQAEEK